MPENGAEKAAASLVDDRLVGPRPLLPRGQPRNIEIRLMVRPGITGWAQVNGGVLLSPDEKERLDEWYIRNASLWLDLRIAVMTASMFFRGTAARRMWRGPSGPASPRSTSHCRGASVSVASSRRPGWRHPARSTLCRRPRF
jgi:hypothetical protein